LSANLADELALHHVRDKSDIAKWLTHTLIKSLAIRKENLMSNQYLKTKFSFQKRFLYYLFTLEEEA